MAPEASNVPITSRKIAILVPLSGRLKDVGQALVNGAQLALDGGPQLIVKDTSGTADGAAAAAKDAIAAGASMILGPLTAAETAAVAPLATQANIPVLAFTNDTAQAKPGVWTLGISPGQQVRRLLQTLQAQDKHRVAALVPSDDFGHAMATALTDGAAQLGMEQPLIREYGHSRGSIATALSQLTGNTPAPPAPKKKKPAASDSGNSSNGTPSSGAGSDDTSTADASPPAPPPLNPPPFDALLLAETGSQLGDIASALPHYDVKSGTVRVLGPALWGNSHTAQTKFDGAWYAAPDPSARSGFDDRYRAKYGNAAPPIADLGFDAGAIGKSAAAAGFTADSLNSQPFAGVDGLLALSADGKVRRGLAVFELHSSGAQIIDPAPKTLDQPTS